jgi:hypothetical protein
MSTIVASSFCKENFGSKSYAIVLENGANLRRDFEDYLIHKLRKCLLHEAIPSFFFFFFAFFVLGIWNDLLEFVEWNHFDGLNAEKIMNK